MKCLRKGDFVSIQAFINRLTVFHSGTRNNTGYRLLGRALWHNPIKGGLNLLNVGKAVAREIMPASPDFLPPKIALEVTNRCNLKCNTCILGTTRAYRTYSQKDMSFEEFQYILNQIPTLLHIWMNGFGEPLLNADLARMLAFAHQKGLTTSFITNGILLDSLKIHELIDVRLTNLGISINSLDEKSFARFRSGASLRKILCNVQTLISTRRERRSAYPKVDIRAILMRDNINSAVELVRSAADIGIDRINFMDYVTGFGEAENDEQRLAHTAFESLMNDLVRVGRRHRIAVINHKVGTGRGTCTHPWLAPFISAEGYVMPCCFIPEPGVLNFGNIFNTDFRSIWMSPEYVAFRHDFKARRPPVCTECPCY
jgi:MoaA/NifB/PqqE/SkfB family radical SAM enzyme